MLIFISGIVIAARLLMDATKRKPSSDGLALKGNMLANCSSLLSLGSRNRF